MRIQIFWPHAARPSPENRRRLFPTATLLLLAALCWAAIILWFRTSSAMPGSTRIADAGLFSIMWLLMMAAMMFPGVLPFVLLFRTIQRRRATATGQAPVPTAVFVSGYLLVWLAAGLGAFMLYPAVRAIGSQLHIGANLVPYVGGAILVGAGLYQFTRLKNACLAHCRSPLAFVMEHWRDGRLGALRMGATHGLFCLGCCWGIMAVLLVVGLMNLAWMAALSVVIIAEKLSPRGVSFGRAVGVAFVGLGLLMAMKPSVLPADGLTMSGGMQMSDMSSMPSSPMSSTSAKFQTYRASAGPYALTLSVGPTETMLTLAQARSRHARQGEVMLGSEMSAGMAMGTVNHHLELHVADSMGMAVTHARVTMTLQKSGGNSRMLDTVRMYGVDQGPKDLHYGTNVHLSSGRYSVHVVVNGYDAAFTVHG